MSNGKADTGSVQDIENLETLTALEELWLGKNKIVEMKVRNYHPIYLNKTSKEADTLAEPGQPLKPPHHLHPIQPPHQNHGSLRAPKA